MIADSLNAICKLVCIPAETVVKHALSEVCPHPRPETSRGKQSATSGAILHQRSCLQTHQNYICTHTHATFPGSEAGG